MTSRTPFHLWLQGLLGLVTLALFSPALTNGFLGYDDQQYVTENLRVQAGLTLPGVVWACKSFYASNWHPVTWLSHMLDCQLYGLNPAGHHLTNVLLHTANTLLLFGVLRRMTGAAWRSAAVAALFAWHPLHVESVAWVAERKDVLSAFFGLLTIWAYVRFVDRTGPGQYPVISNQHPVISNQHPVSSIQQPVTLPASLWYGLALFLFALGLMSKSMLVTLPFVLLLLDFWPLRRLQRKTQQSELKIVFGLVGEKAPFFILSALCCVVTVLAQRQSHSIVSADALPLGGRLAHAVVSYAHYLGAMLLPRHLAVYYPYPLATPVAEVAGAAMLLALISLPAIGLASRRPYLLVGWLWYLGTLVPVVGMIQVGDQAWADRYTYLPLIGVFIALAWGAEDMFKGVITRTRTMAMARAMLIVMAVLVSAGLVTATFVQLGYWKNTRTLFEHAARVTQHNSRAITVLGSLLANDGKLDQAMEHYHEALRYQPDDPEAHFFLGAALAQQGKLDEALSEYTQALWFKPLQEKTHIFMGVALARQKKYDAAAAHDQAALALNPESALAHNNLARVLHSQGRLEQAIAHYEAALRIDPQLAQAHNNLGVLLGQKGQLADGAAHLHEAVRLNPSDAESQYNLAMSLNQQEKWKQAAEIFTRLVPSRPNDADLYFQYGLALAHMGKTREAMSRYAQALLQRPDFPEALERLAWILATDPRVEFRNGDEAVRMAERACELTGSERPRTLATLASAYAEAGRFPEASVAVEKANALAAASGQRELEAQCQRVQAAVKSGQPWREAPPGY